MKTHFERPIEFSADTDHADKRWFLGAGSRQKGPQRLNPTQPISSRHKQTVPLYVRVIENRCAVQNWSIFSSVTLT